MLQIFRDGFWRDLLVLLLVTVLLGSGVAAGTAYAIDTYFGDTVAKLIGEAGQYDFVLYVRQDARAAAKKELARVLARSFPGARFKGGLALAGTATFFIGLPARFQNQAVFERLGSYFGSIPGETGYTVILEPSLLVKGVPATLAPRLLTEINRLPGVRFAFRSGGDLYLVLSRAERSVAVTAAVKGILGRYQILNIRLPAGYKVDPLQLGDELAAALNRQLHPALAENISQPDQSGDQAAMLATLQELRRFLLLYATKVELTVKGGKLRRGDQLALQGRAPTPPVVGEPLDEGNVVIEIKEVTGERARGLIIQGDVTDIAPSQLLQPENGTITAQNNPALRPYLFASQVEAGRRIGRGIGFVTLTSERLALSGALGESARLLERLQKLASEGRQATDVSLRTLARYSQTVKQVRAVKQNLEELDAILASPVGRLEDARVQRLLGTLNLAATSIDGLRQASSAGGDLEQFTRGIQTISGQLGSLLGKVPAESPLYPRLVGVQTALTLLGSQDFLAQETASRFSRRLAPLLPTLEEWQKRTATLALEIETGKLSPESGTRAVIREMLRSTESLLQTLALVDDVRLQEGLLGLRARLVALEGVDLQGIARQASGVQANLPELADGEIGRSLRLIDRYLAGEVIPSNEINLLVDRGLSLEAARRVLAKELGNREAAVFTMQAGAVQPNMRSELFRILGEVRVTITAILLVVFILLSLLLDHTTLIAVMRARGRRRGRRRHATSLGEALAAWPGGYLLYGGSVGGFLFGTMFFLTGARVPLLPFPAIVLGGVGVGLIFAMLAEKFSPVREAELLAGEALGLTDAQILREIVLPAGRPGLAQFLNQRRRLFQDTGGRRQAKINQVRGSR